MKAVEHMKWEKKVKEAFTAIIGSNILLEKSDGLEEV